MHYIVVLAFFIHADKIKQIKQDNQIDNFYFLVPYPDFK
jgi:hypothetical protein